MFYVTASVEPAVVYLSFSGAGQETWPCYGLRWAWRCRRSPPVTRRKVRDPKLLLPCTPSPSRPSWTMEEFCRHQGRFQKPRQVAHHTCSLVSRLLCSGWLGAPSVLGLERDWAVNTRGAVLHLRHPGAGEPASREPRTTVQHWQCRQYVDLGGAGGCSRAYSSTTPNPCRCTVFVFLQYTRGVCRPPVPPLPSRS